MNTLTAIGLSQLASAMVAGLYDGGTLVNTIYRDAESDLIAGKGDSVTIREPQTVEAVNFVAPASATNITEGKIVVPISHQPYSQTVPTAREMTLAIEDFAAEVIMPQVQGIVEYIDTAIGTALNGTTGTATGAGWDAAIRDARAVLTGNKVPMAGRYLAADPTVVSELLGLSVFQTGNVEGAPSALADGIVGRLYGFTVVESPFVTGAVAYHGTAVAGVFRTPVTPNGAMSGTASLRGITAQVVYGYDNTKLADVVTAQTLFGLGSSNVTFAKRAVGITSTAAVRASTK